MSQGVALLLVPGTALILSLVQCHSHRALVSFPEHCHAPTRTSKVDVSSYSLTDSPTDIRQKSRAQPLPPTKNVDYFTPMPPSTMPISSSLSSNSLFHSSTNIISTSLPSARPPIHHILPLSLSKILCTRIRTAGLDCALAIHVAYDEPLVQFDSSCLGVGHLVLLVD